MCAAVSVMVYKRGWELREKLKCAVVSFMVFYRVGGRLMEMVVCVAVNFMVCYRVREKEGNGDVGCS